MREAKTETNNNRILQPKNHSATIAHGAFARDQVPLYIAPLFLEPLLPQLFARLLDTSQKAGPGRAGLGSHSSSTALAVR